jgi:hypothetical protein
MTGDEIAICVFFVGLCLFSLGLHLLLAWLDGQEFDA